MQQELGKQIPTVRPSSPMVTKYHLGGHRFESVFEHESFCFPHNTRNFSQEEMYQLSAQKTGTVALKSNQVKLDQKSYMKTISFPDYMV